MKDIQIIDNFLDEDNFRNIQSTLFGENFPWYYSNSVLRGGKDSDYQFTHIFYFHSQPQSGFYNLLEQCLTKLSVVAPIRIKANLLPKTDAIIQHGFHVDIEGRKEKHNITTAILYVNSNNGYTLFEDGTKVESVENRIVLFDSNLRHTGTTCTEEKVRIVVNFNFF
mgnify:CR=1 FL=1